MKKEHSVFIKIFAYTMFLLVLMSLSAAALFSRQFLSFLRAEQQRQLTFAFQPIISVMMDKNKTTQEISETARNFASINQSFRFYITETVTEDDEKIVFSTSGTTNLFEDEKLVSTGLQLSLSGMRLDQNNSVRKYTFVGNWVDSGLINYRDLIQRAFLALAFMLIVAILGAVLFAWKITKPLEDEIRRERAMEENQRLFFSAASHELKTPIASQRAMVEGMIANIGDYRDHHKYLRECLRTLDVQGRLVSEILEIVKLSDAGLKYEPVPVDLAEIGGAVLAEYRPLAEQKGLLIQGEFKKAHIRADRNLLHRVLSNVTANAVQNTAEGETIRIYAVEKKHLRLCILNTGAQIPEEILSKLFEPFYRVDTARTKRNTQTGLGLAIVKKSLDRMKFSFALENTEEGVLFWVDLPVEE